MGRLSRGPSLTTVLGPKTGRVSPSPRAYPVGTWAVGQSRDVNAYEGLARIPGM